MKDSKQQKTVNKNADYLLDSIETELKDLWDTPLPEESLLEDMDFKDNPELAELDSKLFEGDELELGLEAPDDLAKQPTEMESKKEDSKNEIDTPVDAENKNANMTLDKEVTSEVSEETAVADSSNKLASMINKKIEEVVDSLVEKRVHAIAKESGKNPADGHRQESTLEGQRETDREKTGSYFSTNELADLMSKRIEMIVARLLKEQMSVITEQIILETMRKILLSME